MSFRYMGGNQGGDYNVSDMMTLRLTCGIAGKDITKSAYNRRAVGITDGSCKMMEIHEFQITVP